MYTAVMNFEAGWLLGAVATREGHRFPKLEDCERDTRT